MQFLDFPSKGSDKEVDSISINPTLIRSYRGQRDSGGTPVVVVLMDDGETLSLDISYTDFQKKLGELDYRGRTYISNHYHAQEGLA